LNLAQIESSFHHSYEGAKNEDTEGVLLTLEEVGSGGFLNSNFMAVLLLVIYLALGE
jgi:hypothetical protein